MFNIGFALNFAGGVAFEAEERLITGHAVPVIDDGEASSPAAFNEYFDPTALCVDGIFKQLLHNRGGAFYDFAGGDFVYHLIFEQRYGG